MTESITFPDSLVFAIAPLGVITAIVSVIRVRGTPFLRSLIGRAREPHGAAELELCSSTSQDVSEMWSNGGVCRVPERPQILEFMSEEPESLGDYMPTFSAPHAPQDVNKYYTIAYPTCGIHLVRDVLKDLDKSVLANYGWIEITPVYSEPRRAWRRWKRLTGWMRRQLGLQNSNAAQGDNLNCSTTDSHHSSTTSPQNTEVKTDNKTGPLRRNTFAPYPNLSLNRSRGFSRRASQLKTKPRIFWLQPGEQRIGNQVFPAFTHNKERDAYITS